MSSILDRILLGNYPKQKWSSGKLRLGGKNKPGKGKGCYGGGQNVKRD